MLFTSKFPSSKLHSPLLHVDRFHQSQYVVNLCRLQNIYEARKTLRDHEQWKNTVFSTHLRTPNLWDSKCSGKISPTKRNHNTWPTYIEVTNINTTSLKERYGAQNSITNFHVKKTSSLWSPWCRHLCPPCHPRFFVLVVRFQWGKAMESSMWCSRWRRSSILRFFIPPAKAAVGWSKVSGMSTSWSGEFD